MKIKMDSIVKYLNNCFIEDEIYTQSALPSIEIDTKLNEIGFSSLMFIKLIVYLEKEFSINFQDEDLLIENFYTLRQIISLLEKY